MLLLGNSGYLAARTGTCLFPELLVYGFKKSILDYFWGMEKVFGFRNSVNNEPNFSKMKILSWVKIYTNTTVTLEC